MVLCAKRGRRTGLCSDGDICGGRRVRGGDETVTGRLVTHEEQKRDGFHSRWSCCCYGSCTIIL
jgi:hypothetical protein